MSLNSLKYSSRTFERVRRLNCLRAARAPSKRRLLHKGILSQHETGPSRPCPLLVEENGAAAAAGCYICWAITKFTGAEHAAAVSGGRRATDAADNDSPSLLPRDHVGVRSRALFLPRVSSRPRFLLLLVVSLPLFSVRLRFPGRQSSETPAETPPNTPPAAAVSARLRK